MNCSTMPTRCRRPTALLERLPRLHGLGLLVVVLLLALVPLRAVRALGAARLVDRGLVVGGCVAGLLARLPGLVGQALGAPDRLLPALGLDVFLHAHQRILLLRRAC